MTWAQFRRRFALSFAIASALAVLFLIVLSNLSGGGFTVLFLAPLLLGGIIAVSVVSAVLFPR